MDTAKVLGAVGIISVAYASQAVFNHWVSENAKVKISELETQRDTRRVQEEKELLRSLIQQQNEEESRRLEQGANAQAVSEDIRGITVDEKSNPA